MKRPILFRGKSLYNGEWVYGDLVHISGGTIIITSQEEGPVLPDDCDHALEYRIDEFAPGDHETVGQWTGLIDSSGRHIFEGDIIANGYIYTDLRYEILYNSDMSSFVMKVPSDVQGNGMPLTELFVQRFGRIVIGNIYDNAELLKTE